MIVSASYDPIGVIASSTTATGIDTNSPTAQEFYRVVLPP